MSGGGEVIVTHKQAGRRKKKKNMENERKMAGKWTDIYRRGSFWPSGDAAVSERSLRQTSRCGVAFCLYVTASVCWNLCVEEGSEKEKRKTA